MHTKRTDVRKRKSGLVKSRGTTSYIDGSKLSIHGMSAASGGTDTRLPFHLTGRVAGIILESAVEHTE